MAAQKRRIPLVKIFVFFFVGVPSLSPVPSRQVHAKCEAEQRVDHPRLARKGGRIIAGNQCLAFADAHKATREGRKGPQ